MIAPLLLMLPENRLELRAVVVAAHHAAGLDNDQTSGADRAADRRAAGEDDLGDPFADREAAGHRAGVNLATFSGGVTNSGEISAATADAVVVANVNAFAGSITNTGALTAAGGEGFHVGNVDYLSTFTFAGNIVNTASISAARGGISIIRVASST